MLVNAQNPYRHLTFAIHKKINIVNKSREVVFASIVLLGLTIVGVSAPAFSTDSRPSKSSTERSSVKNATPAPHTHLPSDTTEGDASIEKPHLL